METHETTKSVELHGTVKLSYEDFSRIPYDGLGHHLINGVHIITPAPGTKHQAISNYIASTLTNYILKINLGKIFTAPIDVKFSEEDGYQPDIVFIEQKKEGIIEEKIIAGPPTLIIEISDQSASADYGWKKDLAEKYDVKEYWVVDLKYQQTEVFELQDKKLVSKKVWKKEEGVKSNLKGLEEFKINISDYY